MAITSANSSPVTASNVSSTNKSAMVTVTTLFFMWGFLTSLNDVIIPHLQSIFELNFLQSMLVQFAFFGAYFIFALPAGKLIEKLGYKRTMVAGLLVAAAGALLFVPSANVPSYALFLSALVVLAAGITVLQVSANPYVSVLGPAATASSRLNLTQAFNSLGTTIGPPLGGLLILSATVKKQGELQKLSSSALQAYRLHEASSVKVPYLLLAGALVLLGLAVAIAKLPAITATQDFRPSSGDDPLSTRTVWRYRHLVLGALGIFVYVGAEVSIGSFLIKYFVTPELQPALESIQQYAGSASNHLATSSSVQAVPWMERFVQSTTTYFTMSAKVAALLVAFYWGGAMVGRFIGAAILQKVKPGLLLGINALVACLLVGISMATTGHIALWSILLIGLFNSVMFPIIFTLGIAELGPLTGKGSGVMVAAIVGGAIIPLAQGALADTIGIHHAFILPLLCYLYIAYYGFQGSKPRFAV